jgi:transposase InsO family protein
MRTSARSGCGAFGDWALHSHPSGWLEEGALWLPESDPHDLAGQKRDAETPKRRFAAHRIEVKRLMTDNAWTYTHNRALAELLTRRGVRHLLIPPRRPQVNGKVERYQQTLKREWALGHVYRSSDHRAQALSHWVNYYNERRPHSSLGGRSPISRVHNVPRQDI